MGTDGAMASRRPRDDPQGMLSRPNHINRTVSRRREERGNSNEFQIEETLMNYLETESGIFMEVGFCAPSYVLGLQRQAAQIPYESVECR